MEHKAKIALRRQYTGQFYRKNHPALGLAVLSLLLVASINLVLAWMIQQMIDTASGQPGAFSLTTLAWFTLCVMLMILALKGLSYVSQPRFIKRAMQQYKAFAFSQLMRKNIASFQQEPTARYLSAFSNDAASVEANYLDSLFDFILNGVLLVGSLVMMLAYSPVLTVIACGFFALPVLSSLAAGAPMERAERKISEENEHFVATLKDCLAGFSVVKAFRAEPAILAQFRRVNEAAEQAKCEKRKLTTLLSALSGITGVAAQLGTFLVGAWLVLSGRGLSVGALVVFLDLTANVINPVQQLPTLLARRKAALGLIDKLAEEMEHNLQDQGQRVPGPLKQGIQLKLVSFGYEPDREVLHQISINFEAGKCYAIVGTSGSGKSTLLHLLMASDSSYTGEICYDGNELRQIQTGALYDMVSLIQQDVFVFDASIRDNITMFHGFPKESVDAAIRRSGLTGLLLERGEDYRCGENGSGLSGGEKQRISIARSLLRNPSVLLADEATAALDPETAYHVTDSILKLDGLTRIVVTHGLDPALLRRYDGILVLKDGVLVETGTFDDLIRQQNYFYSLYTILQ